MTWIVILFLPADEAPFAGRARALIRAVLVFSAFALVSCGSFYAHPRRFAAHRATLIMFAVAVWVYWPK